MHCAGSLDWPWTKDALISVGFYNMNQFGGEPHKPEKSNSFSNLVSTRRKLVGQEGGKKRFVLL